MQKSYAVYKINEGEVVWFKAQVDSLESFLTPLGDPLGIQRA